MQRMSRVRNALEASASSAGYTENDPVCVAWYIDKGKELLDIKTLDMLIRHDEWRVQVLALQSYVKPKELHHGEYQKDSNVEATQMSAGTRKSTLDVLTKSMSQYAETAYANVNELTQMEDPVLVCVGRNSCLADSPDFFERANFDQDVELAAELLKFTRIQVTATTAEFIVDESDVLWYSHSPEIWVQVPQNSLRNESMNMNPFDRSWSLDQASLSD